MNDSDLMSKNPLALWRRKARAALRTRFARKSELVRGTHGSSMVEFALVLPVLLTVLTGMGAFAVGFNNQLNLTTAVGSGAQYLQLIRTTSTDPCKDTLTAIENAAPNLTPSSISLTVTMGSTTVTGGTCAGDQTDLISGEAVTVSATYPCSLPIYSIKFTGSCILSAKVTEYEY